ncbi:hypothetical protein [uncultured Muribaculum sp.]|uniref:hypothetical protein n=1 Tax=uncultured Muribaculum sp. TaxID=1918613 RepID=UPI00272F5CC0|nr:hypothetical protein [uncultured Muribaculum sp.]
MKKSIFILLAVLVGGFLNQVDAQGRRGLRINEVMVANDSNFIDDYGRHNAWIELYNSTYAPMEISSVYLTNNPAEPKKISGSARRCQHRNTGTPTRCVLGRRRAKQRHLPSKFQTHPGTRQLDWNI